MKNVFVKFFLLAALIAGGSSAVNAQWRQSIFLDGLLPVGEFNNKVNSTPLLVQPPLRNTEMGKAATAGFGLGYRISYRFDIGFGIVAPFASADFFMNFLGQGWGDRYTQVNDATIPNYYNVPVMLGVSYMYDRLWNDITPYAEFGLGTDLMFFGRDIDYKYKPSPAKGVAWMVGLGSYFGEHVSAGIYYYGLGKHTVKYTDKTDESLNPVEQAAYNATIQTRSVGELALRIGFHF